MIKKINKIVLAYSGGLDTSAMLLWLKETYGCEVVCYCADVGQGDELAGLEEKAKATGASKLYVEDLREEFVRDFVWTAVKANALYEGVYLLGTSLARPVIAKRQIEIAQQEGADAVAHGATGKGNDQVRFELTYYALQPDITVVAPWRHWDFKGRADLIAYCEKHGIPVTATADKPYSMDRNLMHVSYEGGILEDPWTAPPEDIFLLTKSPEMAADKPQEIVLSFEKGEPVAIDGEKHGAVDLLTKLNFLGGEHGIGRVDLVENRFVGMKSRGVYETPGVTILQTAHRALESITMDREVMRLRDSLGTKFAESVYYGFWFAPEFEILRSMIDQTQETVSGDVRLKLYKGNVIVTGRKSPNSLYKERIVTFEDDAGAYDQHDAEGFIKLQALRLRLRNTNPPITPGTFNLYALPGLLGKADPVFLDIGCNDGSQTVIFLRLFPLSRVYAFEPDPRALESFRRGIKGDRVQLFDIAISDADGTADFYLSDGYHPSPEWKDSRPGGWDQSGSIRRPKEHLNVFPWCEFNRKIRVNTRKLDSWSEEIGLDVVDFIWADVQGAEKDLIAGGRKTLEKTRYFYTEYSNQELYEGQVGLDWIMNALPDFEVAYRFSDDVLLKNRNFN